MDIKREPMVSIIIPNWDGKYYLRKCVESVLNQIFKDYELIVVDNGSADSSLELIKEFKNIKIILLDKNYGFAKAINEGIKVSKGSYVLTLNNDVILDKDCLSELVNILETKGNVGICTPKILFMDNPNLINSIGLRLYRTYGQDIGIFEDESDYRVGGYVPGTCAAVSLYRKELLEDLGGFDEDYFLYYEDLDISIRASNLGWKCYYNHLAVAYHKHRASTKNYGNFDFVLYLCERNVLVFWAKNFSKKELLRIFPKLLYYNLAHIFYFSTKGKFNLMLKSKIDAIKIIKNKFGVGGGNGK